jgi:hypothetical protein
MQIAALESFLYYQGFEYEGYDQETGVVIFCFTHVDYKMKVAFGDECYCCLNKEVAAVTNCEDDCVKISQCKAVTNMPFCKKVSTVSEVIAIYHDL